MIKIKIVAVFAMFFCITDLLYGQDPNFSQFFSSPLNINPALTANINSDWRIISNLRNQWSGPANPYVTGTISYDSKIFQNKILNVPENNSTVGIGGMLMYDRAMAGVVKSTYASLNLSYNIKLADNEVSKHRLGAGFGVNYGRRFVDFDRLNFEEQFTGFGFDTNLPTHEYALSNMKAYFSVNAGITYSFSNENSNIDIGVAGFHLNGPKQTFLQDENQYLAVRKVVHANYETFINENLVLNTNGVYQYQSNAKYFSVGASLGHYISKESSTMINGGLWYWSKNALIPYFGLTVQDFQFGISYDLTISKLSQAERRPHSWELSLIHRGIKKSSGIIPCPWK